MCALHAKYTHGGINGFYSVCPIVDHQTVKISTGPVCLAEGCGMTFSRHKDLHKHWNSRSEHHPLSGMSSKGQQAFTIVICPYCQLTFRDDFIAAKMHIIQNHQKEERSMTALQVMQYNLNYPALCLPALCCIHTQFMSFFQNVAAELIVCGTVVWIFNLLLY